MPSHSARFRLLFLTLALSWAGVIFYLSSQHSIHAPSLFPGQDKFFHLVAFGVLGFLLMGTMKSSATGYRTGQVWLVITVVIVYGLLDEFHQRFVPGRMVEFYDVLADAAGGLLGAWGMYFLSKLAGRSSRMQSAPTGKPVSRGSSPGKEP